MQQVQAKWQLAAQRARCSEAAFAPLLSALDAMPPGLARSFSWASS